MKSKISTEAKLVSLPWSNGNMSAKLWSVGEKTIACVPELGLHCYGANQTEVLFRLFTVLLKYYRQLKAHKHRLGQRGLMHLDLLSLWINGIEDRMRLKNVDKQLVTVGRHTFS
jgi:hypothetical protein